MMVIDIFDVGHGGCTLITCPNGTRLMLDCGLRLEPRWSPSAFLRGQSIDLLIFTNLDEDHVQDLPHVWAEVPIHAIFSNPTVFAGALARLKYEHGMAGGVRTVHAILQKFGTGLVGHMPRLGNVQAWAYWNRYELDFADSNNLSLAVFVRYGAFTILFAGDLEAIGWRCLLQDPRFTNDLSSVNVFMASHHGRESGCCDEVFRLCRPDVFVISDGEQQFESQDTTAWYRLRACGIPDYRALPSPFGFPHRYVLSTRRDGTLSFSVWPTGQFRITPQWAS